MVKAETSLYSVEASEQSACWTHKLPGFFINSNQLQLTKYPSFSGYIQISFKGKVLEIVRTGSWPLPKVKFKVIYWEPTLGLAQCRIQKILRWTISLENHNPVGKTDMGANDDSVMCPGLSWRSAQILVWHRGKVINSVWDGQGKTTEWVEFKNGKLNLSWAHGSSPVM